jgi:hypothetical protein
VTSPNDSKERVRRRTAAAAARRTAAERPARSILTEEDVNDPEEAAPPTAAPEPTRPTPPAQSRGRSANLSLIREQRHAMAGDGPRGGRMALPTQDLSRQLDSGDLVIPRIKISQGLSKVNMLYATSRGKEGVQMGDWYHTTTGKSLGETIYFIPCDMRKSRSLFEQGRGLRCRSFDLLRGEGDPGILCEGTAEEIHTVPADDRGCVYRLWSEDEAGNRVAPPCGITYNYPGFVIVDIDNPEHTELLQGMLQLRSKATRAARKINTAFTTYGGGEWHRLIMEITAASETNTKGTYFVPEAELYASADEPEYERIYKRAGMFARSVGAADLKSSISADDTD